MWQIDGKLRWTCCAQLLKVLSWKLTFKKGQIFCTLLLMGYLQNCFKALFQMVGTCYNIFLFEPGALF